MGYTIEEVKEKLKFFEDKKFLFDEASHTYTYDGEKMFGTTTFLNKFIKPFDEQYWSKRKADESGVTQESILEQWKNKRDRACELGHNVHAYIENFYMKDSMDLSHDDDANERIKKFHQIYDSRLKVLTPIMSEIRIFSKRWKLAGTIDQLYLYNGMLIMGDWKTNQKIKTNNDYAFGKLLPPFDKMKENELNKYSLQISIYRLMLEEVGLTCDYGFICHIPADGEAKIYKLLDFRKELREYLDNMSLTKTSDFLLESNDRFESVW